MRKTMLPLAVAALTTGLAFAAPTGLKAEPTADSPGGSGAPKNVARWVSAAQKIGDTPESKQVHIALFLEFQNLPRLKDLIEAQANPASPDFGKYLSPEEFRARFAPDPSKVTLVQDTLKKLGFTVEYTPKSGLFVSAAGTVGQLKSAFGVSQSQYAYGGKTLRANAETPRLPAKIADIVKYVGGLDESAALLKPGRINARRDDAKSSLARIQAATAPTGNAPPPVAAGIESPVCSNYWGDHTATLSTQPAPFAKKLPWLVCGYTPQQMRQAYGADTVRQTGKGVRVAIVDLYASPTIVEDANRYSKNHGLPRLSYLNFLQIVPPGLYDVPASDPCDPQGWYGEESLDVDAVHSMAPDAFIIYGGIACTDPGNTALYNIIDNRLADIVTNSYGFNGEALPSDYITAENQFFMQAAAQGMSVVFSTGDDGDLIAANGIASGAWEATSAYVTAVGGTSLALKDSFGTKEEWGWGNYRAYLTGAKVAANGKTIATTGTDNDYQYYAGSGGGPSLSQLELLFQESVVPSKYSRFTVLENGSRVPLQTPHRVTPDIAMDADPYTGLLVGETFTKAGDPILDKPCVSTGETTEYCEESSGGTSLSTPLFAGVLALVNEARFHKGMPPIGLASRFLFKLPVGEPGSTSAPIIDVLPPTTPTVLLRGYSDDLTRVRLVTMNASVNAKKSVLEGANTTYRTVKGYDQVTGLGTPNIPALINAAIAK